MKVYLAGVGTDGALLEIPNLFDDCNCFISFYDLKDIRLNKLLANHKPRSIICDSGAHAFFSRTNTASATPHLRAAGKLPQVETYLEEYAQYCSRFKSAINYFVELDTQEIHGKEFQKFQRAKLLDVLGEKLIPVWHANEPEEDFYKLADEFKYIGIEGVGPKRIKLSQYTKFAKYCYEKKTKLHIFASIHLDFLKKVPFYSVDSSAWNTLPRYGTYLYFENGRIKGLNRHKMKPENMNDHTTQVFSRVADFKSTKEGVINNHQLVKQTLDNFKKLQEYYTDLWKMRGIIYE